MCTSLFPHLRLVRFIKGWCTGIVSQRTVKELLALLIHRLGGSISYAEAFRFLFHTANYKGLRQHIQLRKIIHSLRACSEKLRCREGA